MIISTEFIKNFHPSNKKGAGKALYTSYIGLPVPVFIKKHQNNQKK